MTDPAADFGARLGVVAAAGVAVLFVRRGAQVWQSIRRRRALGSSALPELTNGAPGVLLFTGTLCADCQRQKEILDVLRDDLGNGWRVREVQAARERPLAHRFRIASVPATVVLDAGGRPVAINYGLAPAETVRRQLEPLLGARTALR